MIKLADWLVKHNLCKTKSESKRLIKQGSIKYIEPDGTVKILMANMPIKEGL